jgi:hypothetical protein
MGCRTQGNVAGEDESVPRSGQSHYQERTGAAPLSPRCDRADPRLCRTVRAQGRILKDVVRFQSEREKTKVI